MRTLLAMNTEAIGDLSGLGEGRGIVRDATVIKISGDLGGMIYLSGQAIRRIYVASRAASATTGMHRTATNIANTNRTMPSVPRQPPAVTAREAAVYNAKDGAVREVLMEGGTTAIQLGTVKALTTTADYFAGFRGSAMELDNAFGAVSGEVFRRSQIIDRYQGQLDEFCK